MRNLIIEGARQNNLKNISLTLPHDSVIAVTGLSGSGKSSLAFNTIFAEGQWRFIESLSTYARLFLEKLDRPDIDAIHNIRPAIALEQKNPVKGSRSTVGTLTEVYDLLRVLYARFARPCCPQCGKEIVRWSVERIFSFLLENHNGGRALITFETSEPVGVLKKRGFYRIWDGAQIIEPGPEFERDTPGRRLEVVADRVIIRDDPRVADSVELAYREGRGSVRVYLFSGEGDKTAITPLRFTSTNSCDDCAVVIPEPTPLLFSFNHPVGACPECKGFGNILKYDESLIIPDPSLTIAEGAIEPWEKPAARWWKDQLIKGAGKAGFDLNKPFSHLNEEERGLLFRGCEHFYGIDDFFEDLENRRYKLHVRVFLSRYRLPVLCPSCKGKRLRSESTAYRLSGFDIAGLSGMSVSELYVFFKNLRLSKNEEERPVEILRQIEMKLSFLIRVGLDYLTLNRLGKTLSGGEYQRVNLANQIAAHLTGTLYVLDEPTVGLHARDTERVIEIIREIASLGNTVIVVEHDRNVIGSSDWVVELGPGGGDKGGEVIFSGRMDDFLGTDTVTSRFLKGEDGENVLMPFKKRRHLSLHEAHKVYKVHRVYPGRLFQGRKGELVLRNARGNNLKGCDLSIPLGTFSAVTGVSGSGKSSIVVDTLYKALARRFKLSYENPLQFDALEGVENIKGVKLIDQDPIGKTPRSNPVTYLKIFDLIRRLYSEQPYARAHGYTPGFFSFNIPGGRCERCKGEGFERLEMYFFEDLYVTCEECAGKRYRPEALRVTYNGMNIHDVLNMTVDEALVHFASEEQIVQRLRVMQQIALGYLRLGQPATTLSGGEAQRLKICAELGKGRRRDILYILDEPTVGLHYRDILALLKILRSIVDEGNTVVVIEHNLDVIRVADHVIDLGPEGGPNGGEILFQGPPEDLMLCSSSYTGRFLKEGTLR